MDADYYAEEHKLLNLPEVKNLEIEELKNYVSLKQLLYKQSNKGKQLNITILSTDIKTVPTAKGSYQVADIAYKNNTFQGKVEGKKVMSFGATAAAFKVLAEATSGDTFNVTVVKNDKGYNDWTALTKGDAASAATPSPSSGKSATTTPARTTYETPEERAQRQVLIVRQSSVSSAVAMLCAGAKTPPSLEAVLATATAIEAHVFGQDSPTSDFQEEIPEVE